MSDFFKKLQDNINKNIKGVHASVMADSKIATDRYWVKTPAYDLNRVLSGNLNMGLQSRNLVGIVGPEHSMKSSFMILCMVEAIKQGKKAVILDTEGALNAEFCNRWGLDIDQVYYIYSPFISEIRAVLGQIRLTGETDLIIGLDSVGGLDRLKQFEDAQKGEMKADQGLLQKEIRSMLKLFLNICIQQNSIGIATGHMYGSSQSNYDQIGGGKAMKLFPSVLIQLYKRQILENPEDRKSKVLGTEIDATTLKNRMYPPFQKATVQLNYLDGIQPYAGILDLAIQCGIIIQKGSWYSHRDDVFEKAQGKGKIEPLLATVPNLIEDINSWLVDTGYSTVSEETKKEYLKQEKTNEG